MKSKKKQQKQVKKGSEAMPTIGDLIPQRKSGAKEEMQPKERPVRAPKPRMMRISPKMPKLR